MSADNVLGWEIVLKISHLPSKLRFSAKCSFFGQSLSRGHYQPTYQPPEGVYLLNMFMEYTFLSSLMLWCHRSRDQNGPKFNIRSKSLLEPFSKNIFKRSCSLINSVLKNGHDYFFLIKCGSRKSNWKVCQLPAQQPFEVGIKENFA